MKVMLDVSETENIGVMLHNVNFLSGLQRGLSFRLSPKPLTVSMSHDDV